MTQKITKAALLAAALYASTTAFALQSDRNQPIQIEADQGSLDQANQTTTFSGNVIIKQGSLNIHASSVRVARSNDGQQTINASGSPVQFSQTLDGNKGTVKGQANNIQYSSASGVVTLTGNAKVQRDGDRVSGGSIVYNTRTEVYTVKGSSNSKKSGRVSVIIQPNSSKSVGKSKK